MKQLLPRYEIKHIINVVIYYTKLPFIHTERKKSPLQLIKLERVVLSDDSKIYKDITNIRTQNYRTNSPKFGQILANLMEKTK